MQRWMHGEGLKKLRVVLYGITKGKMGLAVVRWRTTMSDFQGKMSMQISALRKLSAIFARIWKGELYERIIIWYLEKQNALQMEGVVLQETMFRLKMQNKAILRLKKVIMRMVKGAVGGWFFNTLDNMYEQKRRAMERVSMTNAFLRKLSALLKGLARDRTTACVDIWRLESKHWKFTRQQELQRLMKDGRYAAGIRRIGAFLYGMVKGKAGEGVYNWKNKSVVRLTMQNRAMKHLAFIMAGVARGATYQRVFSWRVNMKDHGRRQAAVRLLSNVFLRVLKGAAGYSLHSWRLNFKEGWTNSVMKHSAVRQLQQILVRMWKGRIGRCILNWHQSYDLDKLQDYLALCDDFSKMKAVRELSRIMRRMVKGAISLRLHDWKAKINADFSGELDILHVELLRLQQLLTQREQEAIAAQIAEKEAILMLERERVLRIDVEDRMQDERKKRLQLEHQLSMQCGGDGASTNAMMYDTSPRQVPLSPPKPKVTSPVPKVTPLQASSLTHDRVRARAGQILIGFENADPSQIGRVSYSSFEHVLKVYGGIDDHLVQSECNRLRGMRGNSESVDFVEWMCEHCEDPDEAQRTGDPYTLAQRMDSMPSQLNYTPYRSPGLSPKQVSAASRSAHINRLMANGAARLSRAMAEARQ